MSYVPQLAAVGGVMLLACVSPGPDLIAVSSHALGNRRAGLLAALGIASSHAVWAAMAIFGLGLIVAKLAWLYEAIRIAGAAYLIYLGIKSLSGGGPGGAPPRPRRNRASAERATRRA
ncbi:LysE family transporter, partial [Burkholderia multivorans]|uniref:LysE family transporter n=1 Tax=Burkholderia multivorans TaxID=87883 RepID=UPI001F1DA4E6